MILKKVPNIEVISKVTKNIFSVKPVCLFSAPLKVKLQAYKSLVLPHVEYCSSVWDPHTKSNIKKIEAVQRRAARFILNDYGRESSVTAMLQALDLPPLEDRRKINRLTMMHKIVHQKVDLPLEGHLQFNRRGEGVVTTRNHNPLSLNVPRTRTNCFQNSFFPKTAKDWNLLPYKITSISISINNSATFKLNLTENKFE